MKHEVKSEPQNRRISNVEGWNRFAQSFLNRQNTFLRNSTFIIRYSIFAFSEFLFRLIWPLFRPAGRRHPKPFTSNRRSIRLTNQPINQSSNQLIIQSTNQPTNQTYITTNFCKARIWSLKSAAFSNSRSLAASSICFPSVFIAASMSSSELYSRMLSATCP
jgi:hypothetical protein